MSNLKLGSFFTFCISVNTISTKKYPSFGGASVRPGWMELGAQRLACAECRAQSSYHNINDYDEPTHHIKPHINTAEFLVSSSIETCAQFLLNGQRSESCPHNSLQTIVMLVSEKRRHTFQPTPSADTCPTTSKLICSSTLERNAFFFG